MRAPRHPWRRNYTENIEVLRGCLSALSSDCRSRSNLNFGLIVDASLGKSAHDRAGKKKKLREARTAASRQDYMLVYLKYNCGTDEESSMRRQCNNS